MGFQPAVKGNTLSRAVIKQGVYEYEQRHVENRYRYHGSRSGNPQLLEAFRQEADGGLCRNMGAAWGIDDTGGNGAGIFRVDEDAFAGDEAGGVLLKCPDSH